MIKELIETCKKLEKNWERESFPELALAALEGFNLELSLADFESQVADWLSHNNLGPQINLYNNFGEPSLTIFNNGKFAADIYFWRNNDTLIHSHGFRGAFKILYGVSLHEEFSVETIDTFTNDLLKTNLTQKNIKIMKPGDIQQINPGMKLTHRVVHLGNPTVSLCLRTVEDTELSQWHHLSTGLSFQKNHISEKTIKQVLYFQYLLGSDPVKAHEFYMKLIGGLNLSSQIALYEGICFGQLGMDPSTSEVAGQLLLRGFVGTEWFALFEKHFENLQQNLNESRAGNPELKLLAHAINSSFSKDKTARLLEKLTDKKISELCKELKENTEVFSEGIESLQNEKINKF